MLSVATTWENAGLSVMLFAVAGLMWLSLRLPDTSFGRWLDRRVLRLSEADRSVRRVTIWIGIGGSFICGCMGLVAVVASWFD